MKTKRFFLLIGLLSSGLLSSLQAVGATHCSRDIVAMAIGVGIGDAFGAGIETQSRPWIIQNVDFSRYLDHREGIYKIGYTPGNYTDDTSDTLAVMLALIHGGFSKEALLEQIRIQYEQSKAARGGIPRAGFGSIAWVFEGKQIIDGKVIDEHFTYEKLLQFQSRTIYPGNAPVMRAAPYGLLPDEDTMTNYALINADVTHPHPKARAASLLIARAARYMILEKKTPSEIISYCRSFIKDIDAETFEYLAVVDRLPNPLREEDYKILLGNEPHKNFMRDEPFFGLTSDAMRTAGTALYLLKHSKGSPFDVLKRSMQIGGDVDSLAAVTVGIMAGRFGLADFPSYLIRELEGTDLLIAVARSYAQSLSLREAP